MPHVVRGKPARKTGTLFINNVKAENNCFPYHVQTRYTYVISIYVGNGLTVTLCATWRRPSGCANGAGFVFRVSS